MFRVKHRGVFLGLLQQVVKRIRTSGLMINPKSVNRAFWLRHPELDSGSPRGNLAYTVRRLRVKPAMTRGNISNEPFGIMKKNGKKQDFFSKISNTRARVRII